MNDRFAIDVADQQDALMVDPEHVRDVVRSTLLAEHVAVASISIALVDDVTIHQLNREHLQHDYPTDVLSFLLDSAAGEAATDEGNSGGRPLRGRGKRLDGEVILSTDTALREAGRYGWRPHDEVTLYLVHGLLHLCGYDDQTATLREEMRGRERQILAIWGLAPHYEDHARSTEE
jgi:probable rRNA maturation factor